VPGDGAVIGLGGMSRLAYERPFQIDDTGIVAKLGEQTAIVDRRWESPLWLTGSLGSSALKRKALRAVADTLPMLNLTDCPQLVNGAPILTLKRLDPRPPAAASGLAHHHSHRERDTAGFARSLQKSTGASSPLTCNRELRQSVPPRDQAAAAVQAAVRSLSPASSGPQQPAGERTTRIASWTKATVSDRDTAPPPPHVKASVRDRANRRLLSPGQLLRAGDCLGDEGIARPGPSSSRHEGPGSAPCTDSGLPMQSPRALTSLLPARSTASTRSACARFGLLTLPDRMGRDSGQTRNASGSRGVWRAQLLPATLTVLGGLSGEPGERPSIATDQRWPNGSVKPP